MLPAGISNGAPQSGQLFVRHKVAYILRRLPSVKRTACRLPESSINLKLVHRHAGRYEVSQSTMATLCRVAQQRGFSFLTAVGWNQTLGV